MKRQQASVFLLQHILIIYALLIFLSLTAQQLRLGKKNKLGLSCAKCRPKNKKYRALWFSPGTLGRKESEKLDINLDMAVFA